MGKRSHDSISASERQFPLLSTSSRSLSPEKVFDDHISKSVAIAMASGEERGMMQCSLPPHATSLEFPSLEAFETHYVKEHTNRCTSCGKNFPSSHLLSLHLDEIHNPMREILALQGEKTYGCFLEGCDKKCSNPQKRRLHLIDKHNFPKDYNFRIIDKGIDNTTTLLRERRKRRVSTSADPQSRLQHRTSQVANDSGQPRNKRHVAEQPPRILYAQDDNFGADSSEKQPSEGENTIQAPINDDLKDLEASLSALKFVPRSVLTKRDDKVP